jgi:hypothetical protein
MHLPEFPHTSYPVFYYYLSASKHAALTTPMTLPCADHILFFFSGEGTHRVEAICSSDATDLWARRRTMDASSSLVLVLLTLHSALTAAAAADLPAAQPSHRRLLLQQDTNLAALPLPAKVPAVPVDAHVPSHGTGSFPAASTSPQGRDGPSEAAPTTPAAYLSRSLRWLYMVVLPAVALMLLAGLACWLLCRKSAVATIGPWKTGLSGQLQKAFVTGIYCYRIGVLYLLLVGSYMCSKLYYILF